MLFVAVALCCRLSVLKRMLKAAHAIDPMRSDPFRFAQIRSDAIGRLGRSIARTRPKRTLAVAATL